MPDIAVANDSSPYITAYPWTHNDSGGASGGFGTKYANPAALPGGTTYSIAFSQAGTDVAVAGDASPYVNVYPWIIGAGFGTKYNNPASLPAGTRSTTVTFSDDGTDIAVSSNNTPFIQVYPWTHNSSGGASGGFGTKYNQPVSAVDGTGFSVAFSHAGTDIAVTSANSPFIQVYPWTHNDSGGANGGFGTKYSNPGTPVAGANGGAFGVKFSPSDQDIAIASSSSPFIQAYPWSHNSLGGVNGGFGTKYPDPASLPGNANNGTGYSGVYFSSAGTDLAVADTDLSPRIFVYPWTSGVGFGTKYNNPASLPAGTNSGGPAFSRVGTDIAVASNGSPYIQAYPWTHNSLGGANGGFGTKYSQPGTLPGGSCRSVDFSPDSGAVTSFTDANTIIWTMH